MFGHAQGCKGAEIQPICPAHQSCRFAVAPDDKGFKCLSHPVVLTATALQFWVQHCPGLGPVEGWLLTNRWRHLGIQWAQQLAHSRREGVWRNVLSIKGWTRSWQTEQPACNKGESLLRPSDYSDRNRKLNRRQETGNWTISESWWSPSHSGRLAWGDTETLPEL